MLKKEMEYSEAPSGTTINPNELQSYLAFHVSPNLSTIEKL